MQESLKKMIDLTIVNIKEPMSNQDGLVDKEDRLKICVLFSYPETMALSVLSHIKSKLVAKYY